MAKLTTNHQGLILSPTGEAWFAPTPGFEEAVSLTPPRSTIETTTGVGKPRMRDIYLPETRQLLQEADPTPPPAWSVLPPPWTLPVPINRPPCILINGAENTMGEILEISERLLSLSLQAVHSRLDILALPGGMLLRGSMDEFSRQTVGPMILFRAGQRSDPPPAASSGNPPPGPCHRAPLGPLHGCPPGLAKGNPGGGRELAGGHRAYRFLLAAIWGPLPGMVGDETLRVVTIRLGT
jgi:hypothetical protein